MDPEMKKKALRMIPYGLYVLTTENDAGQVAAATINWVTQASFEPPLVAAGVKADSGAHSLIKETQVFALNVLGKDQAETAFAFFKPAAKEDQKINGHAYQQDVTGAPVLESVPAYVECRLVDTIEGGDHSVFIGEVVNAVVNREPEGRPDNATLWLKDLGDDVFYGG